MARTDISYANIATEQNQFQRLGHPGRYYATLKHEGGQLDLTGSNYGYGAMMIGSGSSDTFGIHDEIQLSGGGSIFLKDFASIHGTAANEIRTTILDVSVSLISSSLEGPSVYFFKRQQ